MVKVGIIGAGAIAQLGHIPSYQKIDGVRIVALSDSNREKAETVSRKSNIETYFTDYKYSKGEEYANSRGIMESSSGNSQANSLD